MHYPIRTRVKIAALRDSPYKNLYLPYLSTVGYQPVLANAELEAKTKTATTTTANNLFLILIIITPLYLFMLLTSKATLALIVTHLYIVSRFF